MLLKVGYTVLDAADIPEVPRDVGVATHQFAVEVTPSSVTTKFIGMS
jgi:hypothetical protein